MTKRERTPTELEHLLQEQLQFLTRSADAFDQGFEGEAKRLAVTIRVLVHDTKSSHSLLKQLGKKDGAWLDSALPFQQGNLAPTNRLVFTQMGNGPTKHIALLDDTVEKNFVSFEEWWSAVVFIDKAGEALTRSNVVLTAASQDGGAHVDPALNKAYDDLAHNNSMDTFVTENGVTRPMDGPHASAIRQIAHEVLKSLQPSYNKMPTYTGGIVFGGQAVVQGHFFPSRPGRKYFGPKVGNNERCPCGSGLKYKKCCRP